MAYKTAIFDMDGTILDTLGDIQNAVNVTMAWAGYPERTYEEVRSFVGNGAKKLMERCVPAGTDEARLAEVLAYYKQYYAAHSQILTAPYPGVAEALAALRAAGVRLAVVSNKPDPTVKKLADDLFPGLFDAAVGEREGRAVKPAPDGVYDAMRMLGAQAETTVYIGDSDVDLETAKNAGLDCLAVTWGFRDEEVLVSRGARRLVRSARELAAAVLDG